MNDPVEKEIDLGEVAASDRPAKSRKAAKADGNGKNVAAGKTVMDSKTVEGTKTVAAGKSGVAGKGGKGVDGGMGVEGGGKTVAAGEDDRPGEAVVVAEEPDWEHFAPEPPPEPTLRSKVFGRFRPVLGHEWTLACLLSLLVATGLNWEALIDPAHTLPQDVWDPSLVSYLISWTGHALLTDPSQLWHLNAFYPSEYGLAFTDSLLGYAPFGFFGSGPEAALVRYNIIFILAQALCLAGMYFLARQLGTGRTGAALAGIAVAVAPWRLSQSGHLHVLSMGGMMLALAMLARGHGFRLRPRAEGEERPPVRPGWIVAGWLVATWQITIGFGIGLVFAYVVLLCAAVGAIGWAVRRVGRPSWKLLAANGIGGGLFIAVSGLMALPYLKVLELYPYARRDVRYLELFSPPLSGYFTAPAESMVWGASHADARKLLTWPGEMTLLPGFALYALAAGGLIFSIWSFWTRLALAATVVVTIALGLGTNGPDNGNAGYLLLLDLPGFEGLRTPGRLVIWTTVALCLLAAGGISAIVRRAEWAALSVGRPRPNAFVRLATLLPVLLVLGEGLGTTPHPTMPAAPPSLARAEAPYLVLPSDTLPDMHVMLWSTDGFPEIVNGSSGVVPIELAEARRATASFPDLESVEYLRELGVRTVVVRPQMARGTPLSDADTVDIDGLGIRREVAADAVLFFLNP